jgi:hypothetical protein
LVESDKGILSKDKACASSEHHGSEPSAASRVFGKRPASRGALDPAPGSGGKVCAKQLKNSLDNAADLIHRLEVNIRWKLHCGK